ncbi:hypothetical protein [endosymbiont GvMRE of Glomus versiforme]|uniref:hypothetical protein n=1 Tax=endosymbiont GvMRE of Glomus versiforme TaxID=2039283 RepID=UPI000ECD5F3E|nr:hypothetical protein [endosymbiont GvMRE of Glomus versiforme]RHZ37547.1 hypothetical protein GvMRE_I1g575 [endosymbiont GvMRE of Glomus versiforme]
MTTHTHTHTHKVNSLEEIIVKAKEYANQEDKWDLERVFSKSDKTGKVRKDRIVLKNDKGETVKIYTKNFKFKKEVYQKWFDEVCNIFLESFKSDNQKKENKDNQEPRKEKQEPISSDVPAKNNKNDSSSIIWIIAIVLLVIVGFGVIYWYFKKKTN